MGGKISLSLVAQTKTRKRRRRRRRKTVKKKRKRRVGGGREESGGIRRDEGKKNGGRRRSGGLKIKKWRRLRHQQLAKARPPLSFLPLVHNVALPSVERGPLFFLSDSQMKMKNERTNERTHEAKLSKGKLLFITGLLIHHVPTAGEK